MALVFADLVQETTSTAGTGTLTLTGAVAGFQTFAAIGNANTTYYKIKSGNDSEVGLGTYTSAGTTLSRDTVLYSTAGGTTKITVAAGATVICTYPAGKAVLLNAAGTLVTTLDATINGITVGKGAGAIGTNTAVGASALVANTSGQYCTAVGVGALSSNSSQWFSTAVGYLALQTANASGNTAVGFQAAKATASGGNNSAFGLSTMEKNTTGATNSAFGQGASYTCISGSNNSAFGVAALFSNTAGNNSAFGYNAGSAISTGANNVVIGSYTGAAAPISLTGSNFVVLSDGAANVRQTYNASGALAFGTAGTEFGTSGQVLRSNGSTAVPTWATPSSVNIGFLNIPQNIQDISYTLVLSDSGYHIYHSSGASAATYTIPAASSVAFPLGTAINFVNMATTAVTIAITTDTMYLSGTAGITGSRTLAQYGSATAIKVSGLSSSGVWLISGLGLI